MNYFNGRVVFPEFIYDDRRFCTKLYIFFKFIGLIFYMISLPMCYKPNFYIIMIVAMFLSIINSIRYEYAHFKRYGTIFSSINEYDIWKKEQYPKSRVFFSTIELVIKIVFFAKTFPPQFEFMSLCEIGESIFKIHIFILFTVYAITFVISMYILSSIYLYNYCHSISIIQHNAVPGSGSGSGSVPGSGSSSGSGPSSGSGSVPGSVSFPFPILVIDNQNEECCICLDIDNIQIWSILPCGHKFHGSCISTWLLTNQSCPVCRLHMFSVS